MQVVPYTQEGYDLFQAGMSTFSDVQMNGVCINEKYCKREIKKLEVEIEEKRQKVYAYKEIKEWKKLYRDKFNLDSNDQLKKVLFDHLEYEAVAFTETGQPSTDKGALEALKLPFTEDLLNYRKLIKIKDTYFHGVLREVCNGKIHPFLNLHTARTYRSSSSSPNVQNMPVRDPDTGPRLRKAFIPSEGHVIVEADFGGIETRGAGWVTKDPTLLKYLRNPDTTDMHADFMSQIYKFKNYDLHHKGDKSLRKEVKGGFTFPQFYGDYYRNNAVLLWAGAGLHGKTAKAADGLVLSTGETAGAHLRENGLGTYGRFEKHIQKIEHHMWYVSFPVYRQWKEDTYNKYLKQGYLTSLTGFTFQGVMGKNDATNYPVQSCLEGSSKVYTENGLIPIKDLVNKHFRVWTGFKYADAFGVDMGVNQRVNVELSSGIVIKCDTGHKFKNEKHEWRSVTDMNIGEYVALPSIGKTQKPSKKMTFEFILGFIIGDGSLCSYRTTQRVVRIIVGKTKLPELVKIRDFVNAAGYYINHPLEIRTIKLENEKHADQYCLSIENMRFSEKLEKAGLVFGSTAHTKRVPQSVWGMSKKQQMDFLNGLWRSDGNRGVHQEGNLHMCNKALLQDVQILSSNLGYDSNVCKTSNGWLLRFSHRGANKKPYRRIPRAVFSKVDINDVKIVNGDNETITDRRNLLSGKDITQYVGERIIRKYSGDKEVYRYDKIVSINILPEKEHTYTLSVNDPLHQYVADGVVHKNCCFHCLLWCLNRLHKIMKKRKMKSKIIFQVHDSICSDVHKDELQEYLELLKKVMCHDLKKHYKFIITPLAIEVSASEINGSWAEMNTVLEYMN